MTNSVRIRETLPEDLADILAVEETAFNSKDEPELVRLVLEDRSAEPIVSLLAIAGEVPVGHILFTQATFDPAIAIKGAILAPLAVLPEYQKMGIGGRLIVQGLEILKVRGVDWVFVLGHESYYPRFGFTPAMEQGFDPPYPIPDEFSNAWMAQSLVPSTTAAYKGIVIPADTFKHPQYWAE